jgi:hypothetical protein
MWLRPIEMVGLDALRSLLGPDPGTTLPIQSSATVPFASDLPALDRLIKLLAADKRGLIMVMGKGGVGKTTIAAAVALGLIAAGQSYPHHGGRRFCGDRVSHPHGWSVSECAYVTPAGAEHLRSSPLCRPAYIGGLMPFFSAVTPVAVSRPSGSLRAIMNTAAPGFSRLASPVA